MSCTCIKANPLPNCIDTLIIGEVADTSNEYLAVFKTPDGRLETYEAFNVYGTLQMAIESPALRLNTLYDVWLTDVEAANIETKTQLTIGETDEIECLQVEFYYSETSFETQEITLTE